MPAWELVCRDKKHLCYLKFELLTLKWTLFKSEQGRIMEKLSPALAGLQHIVITGPRNAGKSSLLNNLFGKDIAIVSNTAGTTTDPVTRKIEIPGIGAAAVTDTAGLDDFGELGEMRVRKSEQAAEKSDVVIFVTPKHTKLTKAEFIFINKIKNKNVIFIFTYFEEDFHESKKKLYSEKGGLFVDNNQGSGITSLINKLSEMKDKLETEISPLEGLVTEGDFILLVTPIDLAAPKGRLIMPQVETIRDGLDRDCAVMIVKERELYSFYNRLTEKPKLVITDSQAFHSVAADLPDTQVLTSFSILFARKKGELGQLIDGLKTLKSLKKGSKILVFESCSHHRQADDIGTVKIPRLVRQLVNADAEFDFTRQLPGGDELKQYSMLIHCAGCMATRNSMLEKLDICKKLEIPVTNYGLFLGWANGLLPRALEPFPEYFEKYSD